MFSWAADFHLSVAFCSALAVIPGTCGSDGQLVLEKGGVDPDAFGILCPHTLNSVFILCLFRGTGRPAESDKNCLFNGEAVWDGARCWPYFLP